MPSLGLNHQQALSFQVLSNQIPRHSMRSCRLPTHLLQIQSRARLPSNLVLAGHSSKLHSLCNHRSTSLPLPSLTLQVGSSGTEDQNHTPGLIESSNLSCNN